MERLPRRIKSTVYILLIPTLSLKGEGVDTCAQREKVLFEFLEIPLTRSRD
jgi:hypothetical protein